MLKVVVHIEITRILKVKKLIHVVRTTIVVWQKKTLTSIRPKWNHMTIPEKFHYQQPLIFKKLLSLISFQFDFNLVILISNLNLEINLYIKTIKIYKYRQNTTKFYCTLPLLDYMFRPLRFIIRPSSELIQNYLIPSALWDPVALTLVRAIVLWVRVCYYSVYGYLCYYITI